MACHCNREAVDGGTWREGAPLALRRVPACIRALSTCFLEVSAQQEANSPPVTLFALLVLASATLTGAL